jgi:hypothetical protein
MPATPFAILTIFTSFSQNIPCFLLTWVKFLVYSSYTANV